MKTIIKSFIILCVSPIISCAQNNGSVSHISLFGNPPDSIPKIFAKGVISVPDRYEYGIAISPNYDELFFTAEKPAKGLMVMKKLADGNWSTPRTANLRGDSSWEFEAFYTPDGKKLFFSSDVNDTSRLWFLIKEKTKWSFPRLLESPVNDTPVFWATFSENNTMYYTNLSVFKIYRSQIVDNQYKTTEKVELPFGVHPYVSRDESFILFNGKGDIYVTFKENDQKWSAPIKLGGLINTSEYNETCPSLSPDEKYIFFSRYNDLNEKSDIYWVSASIIGDKRNQVLKNK
ncbi:MAG: PD40 domain-containing protein [Ignavibacteriales bacterium]|nr:PD40 domain-containing protein [Ignavibacteriales bacterium]